MMPSLIIDHLSINLRSGTDNLVSEISFAIKEGESLILLGQSGSGKTMTCSAVLNLLDPKKFKVSGSVFFGETDLLNSSEKQRRGIYGNQIVYIPQNPMTALDPSMRIGRQMDETLRLHSDKSRQQRYNYILRLLHDVGLDDPDRVYRAYPHMLSGGMLQRVIIAMAMMLDAKFVLADEPTTALDVIHRNGIIPPMRMREAAGVPATSYDEWLFRFRVIQRILDELDEELLLLEVAGCQIFLQPLEELRRDLYRQGALCFHADLPSFKVFGEDALHIFRQSVQLQLFFFCHDFCVEIGGNHGAEVLFSLHRFCSFPRFCKPSIPEEGAESYSPSLTKKHGKTEAIPPKRLCRPQSTGKRIKNQPLCDSQSG